jgi:Viral (Superfamily 1) RNA helicase
MREGSYYVRQCSRRAFVSDILFFNVSGISWSHVKGAILRPMAAGVGRRLPSIVEVATTKQFAVTGGVSMPKSKSRSADNSRAQSPKRERSTVSSFAERWLKEFSKHSGVNEKDLEAIQAFQALNGQAKVSAARGIIEKSIIDIDDIATKPDARIPLAIAESESLLSGYATLDEPHRLEIQQLIEHITAYLRDTTRQRPFNALMLAAPGAGKSHFIKQLAAKMEADRVQAVTFNMATMQSPDDLAQPVDQLRNLKVNDRFPLLFLDEFDSDPSRYPALLPLLWEGELQIGHRDLKLGKAVVVLAGSNPDLPKAMAQSARMRLDADVGDTVPAGKLVDLLSRINGGRIEIPDLDLRTEHRDRRVDKVCMTIALIRKRFGDVLNEIPRSLLRFVAHTKFRYSARSIAHLIDLIDSNAFSRGALSAAKIGLPITSEVVLGGSSLTLHLLDKDQGFGIINRWKEFSKDKVVIRLRTDSRLVNFSWLPLNITNSRFAKATARRGVRPPKGST